VTPTQPAARSDIWTKSTARGAAHSLVARASLAGGGLVAKPIRVQAPTDSERTYICKGIVARAYRAREFAIPLDKRQF